jgi:DNA-binding NtrC family response regulator
MLNGDVPTTEQSDRNANGDSSAGSQLPGVLKVFAEGTSCLDSVVAEQGRVTVGRARDNTLVLDDGRASRNHAEIIFSDGRWRVRDLDSRNGTFLEGARVQGEKEAADGAVVTIGGTVMLLASDVQAFRHRGIELRDGIVIGPRTRPTFTAIVQAAGAGNMLHITGETGSGKEVAARLFHERSPRAGRPFVPVNCATIPSGLAERLLFGARKGAYSGADANSDGYLVAADGGTLFLDEVAELSLEVQAKLLRAIETGEVMRLGAASTQKIAIAICSATHADLRARVAGGEFRDDLYFRLRTPSVALPPLRARREEIPWIVEAALRRVRPSLSAHASLVEAALLRPWPGNIRELSQHITNAARAVPPHEDLVTADHLDKHAGLGLSVAPPPNDPAPAPAVTDPPRPASPPPRRSRARPTLSRDELLAALQKDRGNVAATARSLGVHRTQLRRMIEHYRIDVNDPELLG